MTPTEALNVILGQNGAESLPELDRSLYKNTECGAHISVRVAGGLVAYGPKLAEVNIDQVEAIRVGSIVEGRDAEVVGDWIELSGHNPAAAFEASVLAVENRVEELWREANDPAADGPHHLFAINVETPDGTVAYVASGDSIDADEARQRAELRVLEDLDDAAATIAQSDIERIGMAEEPVLHRIGLLAA